MEPPPSIPPVPIEPFVERAATTIPAPPPGAEDVANLVVARLASKLDEVFGLLNEIRTFQKNVEPRLRAYDVGITGAFDVATRAAGTLNTIANQVLELTTKVDKWHAESDRRYDTLGAEVTVLKDWKRSHGAGIDDGSFTAAVEGFEPA